MKNIPYGRQFIDSQDASAVLEVIKSDWITQGPKINEFEAALCKYTHAKYAVAVSNGTAALHLACLAAGIQKADRVITSPITFVASANCVLYCAGIPVFVDIEPQTFNIDPQKIKDYVQHTKARRNNKIKAIIPVHFAGHPCDLEEINNIARKHRLIVIEDAAHALGAQYKESKIGSCKYSDMTIFSFHPVKSITTGEGGAITTNDKSLYKKLLALRSHGIYKNQAMTEKHGLWYYEMRTLGFNYRITDFQCALGISQLKKLNGFIKRRREIASIYNRELSNMEKIVLPKEKPYVKSSWHIYCIRLKDPANRRAVFEKLHKSGIRAQVHYIPVHLQPYYRKNFGYKKGNFSISEKMYEAAMSLPIFPKMSQAEVKYVIDTLKRVIYKNA
jgi:perosamine synthetase